MDTKEAIISEAIIEDMLTKMSGDALIVLQDPKFHEILEKSSWELVSRLSAYLTYKNLRENKQLYNNAGYLFLEIANLVDPEDILFEYFELAEKQKCIESFIIIMLAMQTVLLRLPHRRGIAIGWFCNILINYFDDVHIPQTKNLEGDEQLLLESDLQFQSVKKLYQEILIFFKPFIEEVKSGNYSVAEKHIEIYKDTILKTLLKLFGYPLTNLYLGKDKSTSFRCIAENILRCVLCLNVDVISFLDFADSSEDKKPGVDCEFIRSSLAVFYYLIFAEGINIERVPCVYSSIYLLRKLLYLCIHLMGMENINAQWKGLMLAENALNRIGDKELVFEEIEHDSRILFTERCHRIMVYSSSKKNREKCVNVFHKFLRIFDPRGRFYMILALLDSVKESGLIGYLAVRTKDFVNDALNSKNSEEIKYFTGKCLRDLLKKFFRLENGCRTDIMSNSDQIISCLNFLRYLIIRDTDNATGFFEILTLLNNTYLPTLKEAVKLSREHYEFERNQIIQLIHEEKNNIVSTTVEESLLPNFPKEQKFQIINGFLNTFHLIESLVNRVTECIIEKNLE